MYRARKEIKIEHNINRQTKIVVIKFNMNVEI